METAKSFLDMPEIRTRPRGRILEPFDPLQPTLLIHSSLESPIYRFRIRAADGEVMSVWLDDEAEAKRILLNEEGIWRKGPQTFEPFGSLVPLHLIAIEGDYHARMRSKAQQALGNALVSGRIPGEAIGRKLIDSLTQAINGKKSWMGTSAVLSGQPVLVTEMVDKILRAAALEIVTAALFQESWGVLDDYTSNNPRPTAVANIMHELHWRVADFTEREWRRNCRAGPAGEALDVIDKYVLDRIEVSRRKSPGEAECMIDEWAWDKDLSTEEIRNLAMTFLTMGSENVSTALAWCLLLLSENQDAQEKARQSLENLSQAFNEAVRLYPSVPVLTRTNLKSTTICGYEIPRFTEVVVNVYAIHRNANTWGEDACEFKFERCPVISTNGPPDAFPFGAGTRACVGRPLTNFELRTVLLPLIQAFEVRPVTKPNGGDQHVEIDPTHATKPNNFVSFRPGSHCVAFLPLKPSNTNSKL